MKRLPRDSVHRHIANAIHRFGIGDMHDAVLQSHL